jgi:isochorismate synthase
VAFLFRGEGGAVFAGATPETLCRVRGREVETEALAGSSRPEDRAVGLHGDKDQREHDEVTRAIVAGLSPLCESLEVGQPEVLHLPNVSHLRTAIRGRLKEGRGPAQVAQALHPTPAVGGTPRDRALSFLAEHEELDRGWYAGVVGWLGEGAANLKTALRCALVQKDRARIFVGAGLVKGSTPDGEWAETEAKAVAMLEALAG